MSCPAEAADRNKHQIHKTLAYHTDCDGANAGGVDCILRVVRSLPFRWTLSTISRLLASLGLLPYCLADDDIVDDIQAGVAGVADVLKRVLEDALSEHNCIVARAE